MLLLTGLGESHLDRFEQAEDTCQTDTLTFWYMTGWLQSVPCIAGMSLVEAAHFVYSLSVPGYGRTVRNGYVDDWKSIRIRCKE